MSSDSYNKPLPKHKRMSGLNHGQMYSFSLSLFFLFVLLSCSKDSETVQPTEKNSAIEWERTIGSFGSDRPSSIIQTSDGGYVISGFSGGINGDKSEAPIGFGNDFWVVKLSRAGDIIWENTIGGSSSDLYYANVVQTQDGGYLIGGQSNSDKSGDKSENNRGDFDFWIVKLSSEGEVLWDRTYGGDREENLRQMVQTTDGGFLLCGVSESGVSGDKTETRIGDNSIWLVKTDSEGVMEWDKTIGGNASDFANVMIKTNDDAILIGASSSSISGHDKSENSKGSYDYWIIKLDFSGNILWDRTYGATSLEGLAAIAQTSDGGYVLGGHSNSDSSGDKSSNRIGGYDLWIVKVSSNGTLEWEKTIGGTSDEYLKALDTTGDGHIIIGATSPPIAPSDEPGDSITNDFWVIRMNLSGEVVIQDTFGGNFIDTMTSLRTTTDGGFIMCGHTWSPKSRDKSEDNTSNVEDYWVVKISPSFNSQR